MTTFQKHYLGTGKQHESLPIVKVTINLEDAEQLAYTFEGKRLLTFEVSPLKEANKYGKTHTCYISKPAVKESKKRRKQS
jgi:hypothetical protein